MNTSNKLYPKDFASFCHTTLADTMGTEEGDMFYHGTVTLTMEQLVQYTQTVCRDVLVDVMLQKSLF